ncbi:hypothetical protein ACKRZS_007771 [Fusarium odoratissimum]|uniref:Formylmethionine deformylase-like protein n=3 Tax=Fusarium oxysporum species complex TaxID=171631 RepID=N1SB23_FUSC4|nr:uncharacterized protein FOIG_15428 [Fusarium odoratissimum NRRL 54006]EMT74692.1 hypothetical protein FOC4_g10000604 [Fusarium odoratissimum]EXL91390.1 hypothetical protein FOIG_15428 [Fusarium odoratissimum NRRL 54006]KAK2130559.1 hypothetical protein NOF04DRAFT_17911 [Fusarium oxysporum II5]TXC09901.1 hypothetical protein FocTR4_00004394 [Fusarium oxysporum f. sp. cubense]
MRRAAPASFSGSSQEYQSISLTRFEEQPNIAPSPASTTIGREGSYLTPRSEVDSPCLSPNLHDSFASGGREHSQVDLLAADRAHNLSTGLGVYQPITPTQPPKDPSWLRLVKSKWCMVVCLVFGAAAAVGHHILYVHLHNRIATNQQWWLRLGQFLAFTAKASFVVAVLTAYEQVAWRAVSRNSYTVHAIDSLFGATHNIFELFNKEAWKKSSFAMVLAIYIWLSPAVVIFTSATLNVVTDTRGEHSNCTSIRTLNFSNDAKKSWDDDKRAMNETMRGISISMFNEVMADRDSPYHFDYWLKAAPPLDSIASRVLSGGQPIQRDEVATEICGKGWDCSTTIHFLGPGYKCEQLAKGANSTMSSFNDYETPFNLTEMIPAGNASFYSVANWGEYKTNQITVDENNKPVQKPPFPKNLGAFRTEPALWMGYVEVDDIDAQHAKNRSMKGWDQDYTPVITVCEHWETNYTVNLNYTGGRQSYEVTYRDYIQRVINTTYVNESASDGTLDPILAEPVENYVFPKDWQYYRKIAAYHSLGKKLRDLLQGSIQLPGPIAHSAITTSKLVARPESLPVPDFEGAVQKLYEDMLISLLSDPLLLAVAWASHPNELSGRGPGGPNTKYPCIRMRTGSYFFYNWKVLVAVYAASFIVGVVGVAYGLLVMWQDGVKEVRQMTFSAIAKTTKGIDLDQNGDGRSRIRAVEERPGSGIFEFRVEDYNRWDGHKTAGVKQRLSP